MTDTSSPSTPDPQGAVAPADWHNVTAWYARNADAYMATQDKLDVSAIRDRFLARVRPGGRILDAGCGGGRDLGAFLQAGYAASGFDGSEEMVVRATEYCGGRATIRHLRFSEFRDPPGSWDGIYAMASLLHLPRAGIGAAIARLAASLAPDGAFYFSVKEGDGERIDKAGRPMSFLTEAETRILLESISRPGQEIDIWLTETPDSRGQMTTWVNGILYRAGQVFPSSRHDHAPEAG